MCRPSRPCRYVKGFVPASPLKATGRGFLWQGEALLDPDTRTASVVLEEYTAAKGDLWSSKDMLQLIQRKTLQQRPERSASGSVAARSLPAGVLR